MAWLAICLTPQSWLDPYHGWRISHRTHHQNHGHVEKDESWHPLPENIYKNLDDTRRKLRFTLPFPLLAYPVYLDQTTRTPIGLGRMHKGVFVFQSMPTANVAAVNREDSYKRWHQRLGHPSVMRILLKDIMPAAQNNINVRFILLDKGKMTMEGQNKTCLTLVADKTAAVHFQLWGEECDAFHSGDIIQLSNGIFSYQRNNLVLRAGKRGKIEKVGEFTLSYVETPNISEIKWALI